MVRDESPLKGPQHRLLYAWLLFSMVCLVAAGLFALLVALARSPGVASLLPGADYFRTALVGHVVLAFVIWFLAFQALLWTGAVPPRDNKEQRGNWAAFAAVVSGTAAVVVAAVAGMGVPVLANYIPVLAHPLFYGGFLLFLAGIGWAALRALMGVRRLASAEGLALTPFGAAVTAEIVLIALLCAGLASLGLSARPWESASGGFIESLVWGPGHVLQSGNAAAMVLCWALLGWGARGLPPVSVANVRFVLGLFLLTALPAPLLYLLPIEGPVHWTAFTWLMQWGLGPASLVALAVFLSAWGPRLLHPRGLPWEDPAFGSLVGSMAIFALGVGIGFSIEGGDVRIPAHYHGAIGGVTLAFMGLSYRLLPAVGRSLFSPRWARVQPYLYAGGQALFVLGLLLAGTYGVPRKTFGAAQVLEDAAQWIGMGLMGLGGIIAILGGAAFAINLLLSLLGRTAPGPAPVREPVGTRDERLDQLPVPL